MKLMAVMSVLGGCILIQACSDSNAQNQQLENGFTNVPFSVLSQGHQTDETGGQLLVAKNEARFDEIWQSVPSISGDIPDPNFETNQVATVLSTIAACASLEVTNVSENGETTLIEITKVISSDPGLCDPTLEAFSQLQYAMVEFERNSMPISILYRTRSEF